MEHNPPSAPLLPGRSPKPVESQPITVESESPLRPDTLNEYVLEPGDPDGVIEEEQRQAEAKKRSTQPLTTTPVSQKKRRAWPVVLLVLVLLAAAIAGSYWFGSRKAAAPAQTTTKATTAPKQKAMTKPVALKHYDSTTYTLGLDYPETWTLSDTAARLSLQSPSTEVKTSDGSTSNVRAVITIQNPQTTSGAKPSVLDNFPADGAVATVSSDKLSYKKPTEVQRAETYLSYLSYGSAKGLDRLFLTGDNGYQQGQLVPVSDVSKGNPLVGVAFATCTNNDCVVSDNPTYQNLERAAYKSSELAKQVTAILESLQFN
jgi:hypothetical protein